MRFYLNSEVLIQLLSTIVTLMMVVFLFFHLLKGQKKSLLYAYVLCQSLLFIWALSELLEAWTVEKPSKWLVIQMQFLPVCFIGFCWLILCMYATEHKLGTSLNKIGWFFIPPFILYMLLLTNESHHLFFSIFEYNREVFGIGFWVNMAIAYFYILLGMIILFRYSLKKYHIAKNKYILLSLAALTPVLANILFVTKAIHITYQKTPIPYDITPNAFSITVTLITIVIIRYRFPNIWPLALGEIVDNFKEAVLVVDSENYIVNYNRAFQEIFLPDKRGEGFNKLANVIDLLKSRVVDISDAKRVLHALHYTFPQEVSAEVLIANKPRDQWFFLNIRPVLSHQGEMAGRIIALNDISNYKYLMNELNQKNEELRALNEELLMLNGQLEEYAATVEEFTIKEERNRIARDAHDTLSNTMALLIKMLEASIISCEQNSPKTKGQILEAIQVAREGLGELRRSMLGLVPKSLESGSLKSALEVLIADFRASGLKIDFSTVGIADDYNPACSFVIYKICQEALTNAVRHGQAQNVTILLKKSEKMVRLIIIDDGRGCREIHKGFGLSGMEQRVKSFNGDINFYSDGETGFNIKVEIPVNSG